MGIIIATKTLAAIDQMIHQDQGAKFRQILGTLIGGAKDAYEGQKDEFRSHLGASMIGRECPRELWYNFRWAKAPEFPAQIIRLFNRGHLEEPRLVAMLMAIGCDVWSQDAEGNQFRINDCGGHFGSAIDAAVGKCPDVPNEPILGEFKTYNDKNFKKLVAEGMQKAKPEHYAQVNVYMGKLGFRYTLYLAINKNDDSLYAEIIRFDPEAYQMYIDRAHRVIFMHSIPPRINESAGFWKCKYCDYNRICHVGDTPRMNCRTCAGSIPRPDGTWFCMTHQVELDKKQQMAGCQSYDKKLEFNL